MKSFHLLFLLLTASLLSAQTTADFENLNVQVGNFNNDAGDGHSFSSGNVELPNFYDPAFASWSGWAISATTDVTTPGYLNQYSAIAGGGANGSSTYAVAYVYGSEVMNLSDDAVGSVVQGIYLTNSTYAYLSMLEGDAFAKKFGGENGNDPDFFKVTIRKYLNGQQGTDSVEFYLADFRFTDNSQDYIVNEWTYVDLTSLGNADYLEFSLASSDVGVFGINTPTYFCMDDVTTTDLSSSNSIVSSSALLSAWPNPAADFLSINWEGKTSTTVWFSNIYGQTVAQKTIQPGQNKIDISGLAPGMFTLQFANDSSVCSQFFIKN